MEYLSSLQNVSVGICDRDLVTVKQIPCGANKKNNNKNVHFKQKMNRLDQHFHFFLLFLIFININGSPLQSFSPRLVAVFQGNFISIDSKLKIKSTAKLNQKLFSEKTQPENLNIMKGNITIIFGNEGKMYI